MIPGQKGRPIGFVACHDRENPRAVARHLVDLGIPAVIGFAASQEIIDLATELFIPNGVLAIATQNQSALITTIPHPPEVPRLVWRTRPNNDATVVAMSEVVANLLEPQLRAMNIVPENKSMRVAYLRVRNLSGLTTSNAMLKTLRFNGKSAIENGADYREILHTNSGDPDPIRETSVVASLLEFRPHVVMSHGFDGRTDTILAPFEREWPRAERFRPKYAMASMVGPDFFRFIGKNVELRRRFVGTYPPRSTLINTNLTTHYNETYAEKVTRSDSPASTYDAAYLLAYAAYAAGTQPITGLNLARAVARLVPPGEPIDVGPAGIFDAFRLLGNGKPIDLRGAGTSLDFELTTGEPSTDFALTCVAADRTGAATETFEPGPIFRAATKKIEGLPLRCP